MPLFEVQRGKGAGHGLGATPGAWLNTLGQLVIMDWQQAMILDGRGYQVNAGTISAHETGDEVITDTDAEMSVDVASGTSMWPIEVTISIDALGGNAIECAGKSIGTASNAGTAFTPQPLKTDGSASVATGRMDDEGGVQVAAETATNTLHHFNWNSEFAEVDQDDPKIQSNPFLWEPKAAPLLVGVQCFYVQVASASTGPLYFGHINFIEVPTLMVNPS